MTAIYAWTHWIPANKKLV